MCLLCGLEEVVFVKEEVLGRGVVCLANRKLYGGRLYRGSGGATNRETEEEKRNTYLSWHQCFAESRPSQNADDEDKLKMRDEVRKLQEQDAGCRCEVRRRKIKNAVGVFIVTAVKAEGNQWILAVNQ